jgi:hypothetical protein
LETTNSHNIFHVLLEIKYTNRLILHFEITFDLF